MICNTQVEKRVSQWLLNLDDKLNVELVLIQNFHRPSMYSKTQDHMLSKFTMITCLKFSK